MLKQFNDPLETSTISPDKEPIDQRDKVIWACAKELDREYCDEYVDYTKKNIFNRAFYGWSRCVDLCIEKSWYV